MRFLVTGATGFIGRHLVVALERAGHEVVALVRDPERAAKVVPGARLLAWNGKVGLPPETAFGGVDVVVNLIGESLAVRWTEKRKRALRDSRILPTRALVERMEGLRRRPRVLISMSGAGVYGDRGDEVLTEASPLGTTDGFLVRLAGEWEAAARGAERLGVRVALLRAGPVLGRDGGILAQISLPFRFGLGARLGRGNQFFPWIHLDDMVAVILWVASHDDLQGPINAVAPEPVTNAEFTDGVARAQGRRAHLAAPAFALKLAMGEMADEVLLAGQKMSPARVLRSGFQFRYPLLADALKDALGKGPRQGAEGTGGATPSGESPDGGSATSGEGGGGARLSDVRGGATSADEAPDADGARADIESAPDANPPPREVPLPGSRSGAGTKPN